MGARLEIFRAWIKPKFGRKPAEERTDMRAFRPIQARDKLIEVWAAQRDPNTPEEGLTRAVHVELEAAANEEELLINDAGIGVEDTAAAAFLGRNAIAGRRS